MEWCAVYQLKDTPETRKYRFRSYQSIKTKGIEPWCGDYERVYVGIMLPEDTPEKIRERFNRKRPKKFKGHLISTSDVLVLRLRTGREAEVYFVENSDFVAIDGFFPKKTSGSKISYGDRQVQIEGKGGTWHAFDSFAIDQKIFYLLEHEQYGKRAAWIVVDEQGKVVADHVRNGFDQAVRQQMEDYVKISQGGNEQKARRIAAVKNQNRGKKTESRKRNETMGKKQGRTSVLAKLHQKQERIAAERKKNDQDKK